MMNWKEDKVFPHGSEVAAVVEALMHAFRYVLTTHDILYASAVH